MIEFGTYRYRYGIQKNSSTSTKNSTQLLNQPCSLLGLLALLLTWLYGLLFRFLDIRIRCERLLPLPDGGVCLLLLVEEERNPPVLFFWFLLLLVFLVQLPLLLFLLFLAHAGLELIHFSFHLE
jgi:hypothetical protein